MQGELDQEVSKVGATRVRTEFAELKEQKQAKFEQRLREAEERLIRDIRTKVFLFSLVAVMSAVGAMLIGSLRRCSIKLEVSTKS